MGTPEPPNTRDAEQADVTFLDALAGYLLGTRGHKGSGSLKVLLSDMLRIPRCSVRVARLLKVEDSVGFDDYVANLFLRRCSFVASMRPADIALFAWDLGV